MSGYTVNTFDVLWALKSHLGESRSQFRKRMSRDSDEYQLVKQDGDPPGRYEVIRKRGCDKQEEP